MSRGSVYTDTFVTSHYVDGTVDFGDTVDKTVYIPRPFTTKAKTRSRVGKAADGTLEADPETRYAGGRIIAAIVHSPSETFADDGKTNRIRISHEGTTVYDSGPLELDGVTADTDENYYFPNIVAEKDQYFQAGLKINGVKKGDGGTERRFTATIKKATDTGTEAGTAKVAFIGEWHY